MYCLVVISTHAFVPGRATIDAVDFEAWVAPHVPAMHHLAARLGDASARDDIVQDALARAWRRRDTFDASKGAPRTWLLAIVAGEVRRQRRRWRPLQVAPSPDGAGWPGERVDIERAIAKLSERQRVAVTLHYFVDLDIAECAAVMACAPGTVKSTLFDARARLRQLLGET